MKENAAYSMIFNVIGAKYNLSMEEFWYFCSENPFHPQYIWLNGKSRIHIRSGDGIDADKEWMCRYGCVQVVTEKSEHEKVRPQWEQLLSNLGRGDELVVSKMSNAVRGSRELAALIEYCRIKVVRIISIHDKIDTGSELFPDTTPADVMSMVGSLPEEAMALRKASAHIDILKQNIRPPKGLKVKTKEERERTIVSMYNSGHSIDDIWSVSGFHSRSSVFRILNKHGVTLNRGKFSGPLRKRKKEE